MKRKANATGHVRARRLGQQGRVFYAAIRTPDGRHLTRRLGLEWTKRSQPPADHLTRAQAELRLQEMLAGRNPSVTLEPAIGYEVTFGMAAREWMRYVEHDRKRRRSTINDYRRELDTRLIPAIGEDTPLSEITTKDIEMFRERLVAEAVLSPRTINKRLAQLHAIFKRAQKAFDLPINPVAGAERQPVERTGEFSALEPPEVELLVENAVTEEDGAIFTIAAFTGLRLGELRALRWGDVDWVRRLVHVRRSYTAGEEGPPKSGKVRSVPLVDQAGRALDRLSQREYWTGDDDLVFGNPVGEHIDESALRRRFYRALDEAGLPRIRFHDLRHTFGTIAVQAFPLTDVKAFMGHADIQTTMIYIHHVPQHDAAEKLSRLLEQARGDSPSEVRARYGKSVDERPEETNMDDLLGFPKCRRRDSNPRHADYDSAALTS